MAVIEIGNCALDGSIAGAGPPLLFLHGGDYVAQNARFLEIIARHWQVTPPRPPGFDRSPRSMISPIFILIGSTLSTMAQSLSARLLAAGSRSKSRCVQSRKSRRWC